MSTWRVMKASASAAQLLNRTGRAELTASEGYKPALCAISGGPRR